MHTTNGFRPLGAEYLGDPDNGQGEEDGAMHDLEDFYVVPGLEDVTDFTDEDFDDAQDEEWFFVEGEDAWAGSAFPLLRGAVAEELDQLDDEALYDALAEGGFDAEQLESFMSVLGDIGRTLSGALPAIGTGVATGAAAGSVVPGIGTGIGAAVGGILGGLGSVLSQLGQSRPASPRPSPSRTPARPVRPGVRRAPTTPSRPAPSTPSRTTPTPAPSSGSTPSDTSAQTLLRLLGNPQVIQAITSLALGSRGRETLDVAGRSVPVEAFAELLGELAQESTYDEGWAPANPESYLLDDHGEALVDLASPGARAGGLLGLLAAETWGEDMPGPILLSRSETLRGEPPLWDDDGGAGDEGHGPEMVWIGEGEDDDAEAAPAFVAVGGLVIAASQLGIAVFDRLERHLLSGSFSVTAHAANYIHNPSPRGLTTRTKVFRFPITAHHPRYGIGTQTFWFDLTLEYDGFNIRRVSITEDRGRSSTIVSSDFSITFTPSAYTAPNEPVAAIAYTISGRWDPVGRGDESFSGSIVIDAQGVMKRLQVSSGQGWVRAGRAQASGGGPVPRPTQATHATAVHFDRPGATRLDSASVRHLHTWYTGLPASVKTEIQSGRLPIRLTGRASTTGTVQHNQTVARSRAQAVATALRDVAGSTADLVIAVHGELGARTPDRQEDRAERRVDIDVTYQLYR